MSWKAQKSVERIFNTFKRLKKDIWNNDIEALKTLSDELNSAQKTYAVDNILFTKLLCIALNKELMHCKDINGAKNRISKQLSDPLGYHIQVLKMSLESIDKINFFDSKGFDMESDDLISKTQIEKVKENQKELIEKLLQTWSIQKVEQSVYNTANDLLKDLNNYA